MRYGSNGHFSRHVEDHDLVNVVILVALAFAAFCFVLEFIGTALMNGYGTTGQVLGFLVAYPLACFAPIAWGWWLTHRKRQERDLTGKRPGR